MRIAKLMGTMGAVLALSACAAADPSISPDLESAQMVQAQPVTEPAVSLPVLMDNPVKAEEPPKNPMMALRQAKSDSRVKVAACTFQKSRMVCPWEDGSLHEMFLKAGESSTIHLGPDERLEDHYFMAENMETKISAVGSKEGERDVLLVTGWLAGKKNKLVILTNKREYQIYLVVNWKDSNPSLKFLYPEDIDPSIESPSVKDISREAQTRIPMSRLHFGYDVSGKIGDLSGDQIQVFDDGRNTYVIFPDVVSARPPYFAKKDGHGNNVEMTTDEKGNYIIKGVFTVAELQYGEKVIKIKRSSK